MPFSRIAENRIREAIEQGHFDNLPGAGEPLNLEDYFSAPEDLRMAYSILKNVNCRPAEVELLNEIARVIRLRPGSTPWETVRVSGEPWATYTERCAKESLQAIERWPQPEDLPADLRGRILYNFTWVSETEYSDLGGDR